MSKARLLGTSLMTMLAITVVGAGTALAATYLKVYEPASGPLVPPAPLKLEAPLDEADETGGFAFLVGHYGETGYRNVSECLGAFSSTLETNDKHRDRFVLMGATVGNNGSCDVFGSATVKISGFPLVLTITDTGDARVAGTMTVSLAGVAGRPPTCTYSGKFKVSAVTLNTELTMKSFSYLKSKTKACEELLFAIGFGKSVLRAYGTSEPLYTSV
jgi:hypothetical protein